MRTILALASVASTLAIGSLTAQAEALSDESKLQDAINAIQGKYEPTAG